MNGKSKKTPPKIQEMSKEEIRKTVIKKRETNAHAQRIVESLLDPGVDEDIFVRCLPDINQSHFDDVVEERAIAHTCGYPPCCNILASKEIPRQQYRISMKTNKVYDITARKNFCSNRCYKAAVYIKEQMLTSPLWFREYEEVPKFHLMPTDAVPSMGREVDLSIIETIKVKQDNTNFTSVNDFASASFCELDSSLQLSSEIIPITEHKEQPKNIKEQPTPGKGNNMKQDSSLGLTPLSTVNIAKVINEKSTNSQGLHNNTSINKKPVVNDDKNQLNIIGEIIERPENKIDSIIATAVTKQNNTTQCQTAKKTTPQKKDNNITAVIIHVEKCIAEWFTLDSIIFLFGEAKVKEMVADKGDFIKEYLNNMASGLMYSSVSYDQYQQLCRKLNMLELEDHRYHAKLTSKETKPLPDYSILKEEGKRMKLKVKAFLSGDCDIQEPSSVIQQQPQQDTSGLTQLALVDKNAQNALRRKILLTNLHRVLKDLQQSLGFSEISIVSDVRLLVNSFKLKANNIMLKRVQWTLIGVVVLKLMSLRDMRIRHALETSQANQNLQLLLLSYKQDGGYLDRLILWLTDIDRLLNTSDTQFTVGPI